MVEMQKAKMKKQTKKKHASRLDQYLYEDSYFKNITDNYRKDTPGTPRKNAQKSAFLKDISSSFAKIWGETNFQSREFPQSG